ncbi:DUF4232 domain-containing protein [Streptomyces sp. NPDC051907]|uniref:DUF4232 domain-containing protein n=1 Tax=Streptomyces sp. NPDC051907 TaxID=3155284 RepID=UPI00343B83D7
MKGVIGITRTAAAVVAAVVAAGALSGCGTGGGGVRAEPAPPSALATPSFTPPVKAGSLDLSPSATATAKPSPSLTACPPSGAVVTAGEVNTAMGHRGMTLSLRNCGQRPYTVKGYPEVGALDEGRKPLKLKITHGEGFSDTSGDQAPKSITLDPGESVQAGLQWNNRVTSVDPAVHGQYLTVVPVEGEKTQTFPFWLDIGTSAELDVSAWETVREG